MHSACLSAAYDLSDDSWERALDKLLDDPAFLDTVADEVSKQHRQ
jgi:hypothetical protein